MYMLKNKVKLDARYKPLNEYWHRYNNTGLYNLLKISEQILMY